MSATPQIAVQITGKSDLQKIFGQTNQQLKAFQAHSQKTAAQIRSIASVGKAGFAAVDKTVVSLVRNTFDLFRNVSRIVDPLGIITGGATLAGLTAIEAKFAAIGLTTVNTARGINMGITSLSRWSAAAEIAGFSAQTAADGIRATEISSTEARLGQNGDAAKRWGIVFGGSSKWMTANDEQLMMQESKYLAALKGQARSTAMAHLTSDLGQSSDYVSFLAQGPAALQKQLTQAQKNGAMTGGQADVLGALGQGINSLEGAVEGFATSVTATLAPDITGALGSITDWLDKNRPAITADIKGIFTDAENYLKGVDWAGDWKAFKADITSVSDYLKGIDWAGDWKAFKHSLDEINSTVKAIGGWKPVIEGVLGILTASAVASIATPFVSLAAAIATLSGGGAGSFGALGIALRSIGFGIVGGQLVKMGMEAAGAGQTASTVAGDAVTGAIAGGAMFGLPGAGVGGALGAAYGGYEAHAESKAAQAARADAMVDYYRSQGLSAVQAAALVGGFQQESGLDPTASNSVGGGHYGIGQWGLSRQADFAKIFGHDIQHSTLQEQMKFSLDEMFNGKEGSAGRALLAAKTADAATLAALNYERPAAPGTPAWNNEDAWRLANTADILGRNAPQYLPKGDDASNVGQWPTDNEPSRLIGVTEPGTGMDPESRGAAGGGTVTQPGIGMSSEDRRAVTTQPGIGMSSEDRRAVTITVVPPPNHKVVARSTGGPIQVKTARNMPWAGNSGWN
jgi:hypothetical protein